FTHFFFYRPATSHTAPISLPDALPILQQLRRTGIRAAKVSMNPRTQKHMNPRTQKQENPCPSPLRISTQRCSTARRPVASRTPLDRKSTRLNSSHVKISYAVFCLKKKK